MPRAIPLALLLLAGLGLAGLLGCGRDDERPTPPEAPPPEEAPTPTPEAAPTATPRPEDPGAALDWVRAAYTLPDKQELRRRLWQWPLDDEAFVDSEETQVVLTWRIRVALQDGQIERAVAQWKLLLQHFDGHGVSPEGRGLTPDMIRLGLIEEARLLTRRRSEGARAARPAAESAWKTGADLLRAEDVEESTGLERARRWALWETFARWCTDLGLAPGPSLGTPDGANADARPLVIVVADDFALGEVIFQSVLQRWLREGQEAGLRGVLVPIRRGQVRRGLRRVPVEDPAEEEAALREDAAAIGLIPTDTTEAGLFAAPYPDGFRLAVALGLERQETALLIVDRRGRIVGRLSGTGLDPRSLDPVIQKLVSR